MGNNLWLAKKTRMELYIINFVRNCISPTRSIVYHQVAENTPSVMIYSPKGWMESRQRRVWHQATGTLFYTRFAQCHARAVQFRDSSDIKKDTRGVLCDKVTNDGNLPRPTRLSTESGEPVICPRFARWCHSFCKSRI